MAGQILPLICRSPSILSVSCFCLDNFLLFLVALRICAPSGNSACDGLGCQIVSVSASIRWSRSPMHPAAQLASFWIAKSTHLSVDALPSPDASLLVPRNSWHFPEKCTLEWHPTEATNQWDAIKLLLAGLLCPSYALHSCKAGKVGSVANRLLCTDQCLLLSNDLLFSAKDWAPKAADRTHDTYFGWCVLKVVFVYFVCNFIDVKSLYYLSVYLSNI